MPKANTPDVTYATITIDEKEAEALLAVLSQAADFCEQHGAERDLVKRLKAAIDKLTANRDTAVDLTHFGRHLQEEPKKR